MGFLQCIINRIFPKLSEEQRSKLQRDISAFDGAVDSLGSRYITFADMDAFLAEWSPVWRDIESVKVPKKDPAYPLVHSFFEKYSGLGAMSSMIEQKNRAFIQAESARCDGLLSDIDGKSLDSQQREAVICNEHRNLVLAGAGSGKTLTIAGKVKYLCQEQGVSPEDILLIAFTKKSAEEMTTRISDRLGIPVTATTFHKLGLDIITDALGKRPDVCDDLSDFVRGYFENTIMNDPTQIRNLIEYFAYYLSIPADMDSFGSLGEAYDYEKSADLETIKSKYDRQKFVSGAAAECQTARRTLRDEQVKSLDEVAIANFLFLNGVKYEYERLYPFEAEDTTRKAYRPDFYLPDFDLYLEHFGVDRQGRLPWLSGIEEQKYQEEMTWKREFHKQNGTKLIETYSYYTSDGCLIEKLAEILQQNGVKFREPDFADIFNTVYTKESDKYFSEFIRLCCTFITLFKSNGYKVSDLFALHSVNPKFCKPFFTRRTELFKSIVAPILVAYDSHLAEIGAVDFSDMINQAADKIVGGLKVHLYKWVIIDEYQDISVARYKLVKAILDQTGAKLLCVGDDWQSIYRFAGSDITLFTHFEQYFGRARTMKIEKTYRNSQQLIDEAGAFVMRNPAQLQKQLRSDKHLDYPITFMCYKDNPFAILQKTVDKIIHDAGSDASILLLGRTNYDLEMVSQSGLFTVSRSGKIEYRKSSRTPITFMSVHKAKGLEADNVVLLNFQNSKLGFPNKISDDPVLELVLTAGDEYQYAEERRLLYVALTRTRNRVFVLVNEHRPSEFMKEFQPSGSVYVLSDATNAMGREIQCPRCRTGHMMVRKNEGTNRFFVGCSNYPKCTYTVNDTAVMNEPKTCPSCGGFLVLRKGKYGAFYGCTNYPRCNYTEQKTSN